MTIDRTSAAWPLVVAIAAALNDDSGVVNIAGADCVFADRVPSGQELPYITLGTQSEQPSAVFGTWGHSGAITLDIWAEFRETAVKLFQASAAALDGRRLTLTGHTHVTGLVTMAAVMRDPSGIAHLVARYESHSRVGAA